VEGDARLFAEKTIETFYFWTGVLMWLIHAGFMIYEAGVTRQKNVLMTMMKNLLTCAVVTPTFFLFGWWIYYAFPSGLVPVSSEAAGAALPWSQQMGPNLQDNITGVFWFAFLLFSFTTASIMSGAVIERIRLGAYLLLATVLGSMVWILAAAWGWSGEAWLYKKFGFHDWGAGGCVHTVAAAFTLGVLLNLGPRIGKYDEQGRPRQIMPHNLPMTMLGLMLIFTGFYAFYAACAVFQVAAPGADPEPWRSIYLTPMTLGSLAFTVTMGFAGGAMGAFIVSRGDPYWTISGGLAGMISIASGVDVYHPALGYLIGFAGGALAVWVGNQLERRGIDDAVGAIAVHGGAGLWSMLAMGLFASGYPQHGNFTSLTGQLIGMAVMVGVGFVPGYLLSLLLDRFGTLRVSRETELAGLDVAELGIEGVVPAGQRLMANPAERDR
jgi:ammonia channel protein AmtB